MGLLAILASLVLLVGAPLVIANASRCSVQFVLPVALLYAAAELWRVIVVAAVTPVLAKYVEEHLVDLTVCVATVGIEIVVLNFVCANPRIRRLFSDMGDDEDRATNITLGWSLGHLVLYRSAPLYLSAAEARFSFGPLLDGVMFNTRLLRNVALIRSLSLEPGRLSRLKVACIVLAVAAETSSYLYSREPEQPPGLHSLSWVAASSACACAMFVLSLLHSRQIAQSKKRS